MSIKFWLSSKLPDTIAKGMHWADRLAKEIINSGQYKPYRADDMFTPSGFAHVGSLRGPFVHDFVYKALKDAGQNIEFTFVLNDFDPFDGIPPGLENLSSYLGFPLRKVPSPQPEYESFADYFAKDFANVLSELGIRPKFYSSWDMYHEGKFDGVIRIALDNAEVIQDIYQRVAGSKKREQDWLPLQVICEKCGKLGTTRVYDWDGETVAYRCEPDLVKWAKGCGHKGRISPFDGNGKLPWKVDWPAHWTVLKVTVEGAGKDHSSAGGSRDIARELCKHVFKYPEPFNMPYEFFLLGGRKMSSSKGVGLRARDLAGVLPPNIARFLFSRTDYRQTIEFDPSGTMAIPDLFDEYDRAWQAYIERPDESLSRTFEFSQVKERSEKKPIFLPRFRDVANYMQLPNVSLADQFEDVKRQPLASDELEILKEREKYAKIWLDNYAPDEFKFEFSESLPEIAENLSDQQKKYLQGVSDLINKDFSAEDLQVDLYNLTKKMNIGANKAFRAIYLVMIGKDHGPKAAWFLKQYPKEKIIKRLKEASE